MPSAWNMFVKKIYEEGKAKDSNYEFKQALMDASKRKGEMGSASGVKKQKTAKKSRSRAKRRTGRMASASASAAMAGGRRTRRRRRH
jgi:hypothetical protein